jgi:hypothetical protein
MWNSMFWLCILFKATGVSLLIRTVSILIYQYLPQDELLIELEKASAASFRVYHKIHEPFRTLILISSKLYTRSIQI